MMRGRVKAGCQTGTANGPGCLSLRREPRSLKEKDTEEVRQDFKQQDCNFNLYNNDGGDFLT